MLYQLQLVCTWYILSCTNNKDVFICTLHFHARQAYLQHYQTTLQDLEGLEEQSAVAASESEQASGASTDSYEQQCTVLHDQNFNVACEAGIQYPSYEVMCCREKMYVRVLVNPMNIA